MRREREKEERTENIAGGGRGEEIIRAKILFTRRLLRVPATPRWHREMDVRSINTPCDKQKKENGGGCVTLKPLKDETERAESSHHSAESSSRAGRLLLRHPPPMFPIHTHTHTHTTWSRCPGNAEPSRLRLIIIIIVPGTDSKCVIVRYNRPDGFDICPKILIFFSYFFFPFFARMQVYHNLCLARKQKKRSCWGRKHEQSEQHIEFNLFGRWNGTLTLPADTKTKLSDCLIHFSADVFFSKMLRRSISYHILTLDIFLLLCWVFLDFSKPLANAALRIKQVFITINVNSQRTFDTSNIWTV